MADKDTEQHMHKMKSLGQQLSYGSSVNEVSEEEQKINCIDRPKMGRISIDIKQRREMFRLHSNSIEIIDESPLRKQLDLNSAIASKKGVG